MIRYLRFHGRGGEGVKLACRITSRAAFLAGAVVQDSPLYGAERRGAPVVAFARIGDAPIRERGYVADPDVVVVMDASLLADRDAGVLDGVADDTLVLVNSPLSGPVVQQQARIGASVACLDLSAIALELTGAHVLSAAAAACAVKATGLAAWPELAAAIARELADAGVDPARIEPNLAAARAVFAHMPRLGLPRRATRPAAAPPPLFHLPRIGALAAAPTTTLPGSSARHHTEGWRVARPQLDAPACTRCLLCFVLCPEGAIALTADHLPVIDYAHCKGCLICAAECPTGAIRTVREAAP